jgi:hypothetical protein
MTARWHALAAALLGLAVSACAANAPTSAPAASGAPKTLTIVVRGDLSPRYIEFIGPKTLFAKPFLDVPDTNYFALRSWLDKKTGDVAHQLYVSESYAGARRTWLGAHAGKGDALTVVAISSHEIACQPSCSYTDDFAASLSDALLRKSLGGLAVTFTAKGGSEKTIAVPAAVVKAELETVDAWRRGLEQVKTASTASQAPDRRPSTR